MQSNSPRIEEYQIDSDEAVEIAPTIHSCTGEIGLFRNTNDGGAQGLGILPPPPLLVLEKYHSIQLIERESNLPIFEWEGEVVFNSESWTVAAKGTMVGSVKFNAKRFTNEMAISSTST
jgi:hypothetical protein